MQARKKRHEEAEKCRMEEQHRRQQVLQSLKLEQSNKKSHIQWILIIFIFFIFQERELKRQQAVIMKEQVSLVIFLISGLAYKLLSSLIQIYGVS